MISRGGEYKFGKDHARKKLLREIFRKKQINIRKMPEPGFMDSDSVNSQVSENNKNKKKRTIKDYLRMEVPEEKESDLDDNSDLEMSEIVTSEEGNRKLIVVGNDVIGLFPAMQEVRTGGTVATQSMKNEMANKGLEYMEIARYCAINRHLCGDLSEVENVLPWRTKWGKGGKKPGMQNEEVKGKKKNLQNVWTFPKAKPTDCQKKVLAARMGEIGVRVVWRNFMFQFGGHTYLQSEGGPIGARLTMACARLVMQDWAEEYKEILTRSGLDIDAHAGYVDDGRQATPCLIKGSRFVQELKRFMWRADWEQEDMERDLVDEVRMAEICKPAMNSINEDLKFTTETASDFENGRLATLDFETEVVENQIIYSYYQKPMKTSLVLMERSAMSNHQKISIMANEVIRRLSNVHKTIPQREQNKIVDKLTQEMKNSGYSRKQSREAIVCGLLGIERKIKRRHRDGQKFHRKASTTLLARTKKKLTGKTSWFKNNKRDPAEDKERKKETKERRRWDTREGKVNSPLYSEKVKNREPKAVIFVPCTPNSGLVNALREGELQCEDISDTKVKFEELAGMQLARLICKTDPWSGKDCDRSACTMCETRIETGEGKEQDCSKRNILYETWCRRCKEEDENKATESE